MHATRTASSLQHLLFAVFIWIIATSCQPASDSSSKRRRQKRKWNTDSENHAGEWVSLHHSPSWITPTFVQSQCRRGSITLRVRCVSDRRQSRRADWVYLRLSCEIESHCRKMQPTLQRSDHYALPLIRFVWVCLNMNCYLSQPLHFHSVSKWARSKVSSQKSCDAEPKWYSIVISISYAKWTVLLFHRLLRRELAHQNQTRVERFVLVDDARATLQKWNFVLIADFSNWLISRTDSRFECNATSRQTT